MRASSLTNRYLALGGTLAAALLAFVVGPGFAQASYFHHFDQYFGGSLATPEALAVDQSTGDVYVLESSSGCISRFHGDRGAGAFSPDDFSALSGNQICGLAFNAPSFAQIAIDNSGTGSEGTIYVTAQGALKEYYPSGELKAEFPSNACGVATDPAGNVFLGEYYVGVAKYHHDDPLGPGDYFETLAGGPLCGVAVDAPGRIYESWPPSGPLIKTPANSKSGSVLADLSTAITVDPVAGDLYNSEGEEVRAYTPTGIEFDRFGAGDLEVGGSARGVAIDSTTGTLYASDTNGNRIAVFGGTLAYRLGVEILGTGFGQVSAGSAPISDCGGAGLCEGIYAASTIVLTATAQPHSTLAEWKGCDDVSVQGNQCTVELSSAREVSAQFTRLKQPVTVTTTGTGDGSVTAKNNLGAIQGCGDGGVCTGQYDEGSVLTLIPSPIGHSAFTGWSGACTNGSGPCEVVVESAPEVTAHFTQQHGLEVHKAGGGSGSVRSAQGDLNCGAVCSTYFTDGATVDLTATASAHSTFEGWSGVCSGASACQVPIGNENKSVTAVFSHDPPTATTDPTVSNVGQHVATVNGSVNPEGAVVTDCRVEYGPTSAYGSSVACSPSAIGSGVSPAEIGANLTGLAAGSTYHFRVSATTAGGSGHGTDQTLQTLADTCDSNALLCPPPKPREKETRPGPTCKKGYVPRKGHCVKRHRSHHRGHRHDRGGAK